MSIFEIMIKNKILRMIKDSKTFKNSQNFSYPPVSSIDMQRVQRLIYPFQRNLQQSGIDKCMDFISLLKEHSKIENAPKNSKNQHIITKKHLRLLIEYLKAKSNCQLEIKSREFNRSHNNQKNIIFTFFASEYPSLMRSVTQNNFQLFEFSVYLYKVEDLVNEWLQYIDEVQKMKCQKKMMPSIFPETVLTESNSLLDLNFDSDDSMFPQIDTCDI